MKHFIIAMLLLLMGAFALNAQAIDAATGKITYLRVSNYGDKYGPATDKMQAEAVIKLDTKEGMAFGFQLHKDNDEIAHQDMLKLLQDAFANNWKVTIDYLVLNNKKNLIIVRAGVVK